MTKSKIHDTQHADISVVENNKTGQLLRIVIDNTPQYILWKNRNLIITGCNKAFADDMGADSIEDIIGKTDYDFPITKEEADSYRESDRRVMESGKPELHIIEHKLSPDGKNVWLDINRIPMYDEKNEVVGILITVENISERYAMEKKKNAHLYFVDKLEQIDKIMRKSVELKQVLRDVLAGVLKIFECDRAWLLFPGDPKAESWKVPMEQTKPEYPGACALGEDIPMSPEMAKMIANALEVNEIVTIDYRKFDTDKKKAEQFNIKSEMHMVVYPQTGKPWIFGVHQCSYYREWTKDEQDLFREIGRRIGDGLSIMLSVNVLRSSEKKERDFREKLTILHDVSIELSKCKSEDEFWEKAVTLGRSKLGFDRLGIWLKTEKPGEMRATFGTDLNGNITDERHYRRVTDKKFSMIRALELKIPCYYEENENIYDDNFEKIIGHVACAVAPLWDGDNIIGSISTDNFICKKSITESDRKLLVLFASSLGRLGARVRNEEMKREFQEKITTLHDVSTELSKYSSGNDLCKQAVILGRKKLGFDRLGIWLIVEGTEEMQGTFGTDVKGNITDEHNLTYKYNEYESVEIKNVIKMKKRNFFAKHHEVLDKKNEKHIGFSEFAVAPLWNGVNVVGIITMDNFIQKKNVTENNRELLMLYASLLGHLVTRIRNEKKQIDIERKMLHAQKLESLGVLAGGIAHDFNNILMAVLGYSDLILQELPLYSPVRGDVSEIQKAASRAAELSKQMLAYSGKGKFVIEPVDLNGLVKEMSNMLNVAISKKVELKYDLENNLPMFKGDVTQIRQIIMNMITNASEAIGGEKGVVSISTGTVNCDVDYINSINIAFQNDIDALLNEGEYVYIEFSDTGCGMNKETQNKLFDPFFTTKFTGRGLGMAAVLGIVKGHKGAIKIYSEINKGTRFTVLFPITEKIEKKQNQNILPEKWAGVGTILIADDEESTSDLRKRMIEMIGFKALIAADGQQAVELFKQNEKDIVCVILDLVMPNLNGEQAFHKIKLINPNAKIIISSGYNEIMVKQNFLKNDLAGFIQKPYSFGNFSETIRKVVG